MTAQKKSGSKAIIFIIIGVVVIGVIIAAFLMLRNNGGGSDKSDDPNLGVWKATTGEMFGISVDLDDVYENGFTIELKAKGKCSLNIDGKKANGSWTLEGSAFTVKGGGLDCEGKLENGKLILEDVLGSGLNLVFEKEGGYAGASQNNSDSGADTSGTEKLSDELAWWDGGWYGYWEAISVRGEDYEIYEDELCDCYAIIDIAADGSGVVYLWDDVEELGTVNISINSFSGSYGSAVSNTGVMFGFDIEYADWNIVPEWSEYENCIVINASHERDADDYWKWSEIEYRIVLRPWGMLWDDIPEDEMPPDYEWWYKGKEAYTMTMYDALYEPDGVFVHPRLTGSGSSSSGSGNSGSGGSGSETGNGTGLVGPTADIILGEDDVYTISYPTDRYEYDSSYFKRLTAKDGSVKLMFTMETANSTLEGVHDFMDSYDAFDDYSTEDLTIAGFKARRITYKDWGGEFVSKVFIDFNFTGPGTNGYRGISIDIISEKSLADTWTSEIRAILETSKISQ